MKSIIPVVMAGIIAIYGLVVAVLIARSKRWGGRKIFTLQGIRSSRRWACCRIVRFSGRLCNRNRRRRWSTRYCATTKTLCWNDPYPNFCRSVGSVWTYCCYLSLREVDNAAPKTVLLLEYLCQPAKMAPLRTLIQNIVFLVFCGK